VWSGYCASSNDIDTFGLMQIVVTASSKCGEFVGSGSDAMGTFNIHGNYLKDNSLEATFTREKGPSHIDPVVPTNCVGKVDVGSGLSFIQGEWGVEQGKMIGKLTLRPISAQLYPFRYSDDLPNATVARTRWSFACSAVLDIVRRRLWSWSFFKNRFIERRRYVELFRRRYLSDVLDDAESKELNAFEKSLSPTDTRFYRSIARSHYNGCIHL
jgi:hypothetical protein